MKKAFNILTGIFSGIILLISIVFIVIEGRLLFSGDWLIYDNVVLGFFKYFFRLLIALMGVTYSIFQFINFKKDNKTIQFFLYVGNICLLIIGTVLVFTATNYVGEVAILIAGVTAILNTFKFFLLKNN